MAKFPQKMQTSKMMSLWMSSNMKMIPTIWQISIRISTTTQYRVLRLIYEDHIKVEYAFTLVYTLS